MTHTAEPMTLEQAKDICMQWIAATAGNGSMCAMAERRIKEVFAELSKQREAQPVALDVTEDIREVLDAISSAQSLDEAKGIADKAIGDLGYKAFIYANPQQRNAVENDLVQRLRGRADYLRNLGRIKSPQLMESAATALSAVASRDRKDAEHQLRDLHRAIESNLTGSSIEQGKSPMEYKEGLIKAYGHCREMVSKHIDAIRTVRDAMNAARRENKS